MRKRLIIVLVLIVLAPLAILAWLGAKLVRDEQAMVEHRFAQLIQEQLRTNDRDLMGVIANVRRKVSEDLRALPDAVWTSQKGEPHLSVRDQGGEGFDLRDRARRSPLVTQYFKVDADGTLAYPSPLDPLTPNEEDFLNRTRDIWERQALTHEHDEERTPPQAAAQGGKNFKGKAAPRPGPTDGWYSWYWGDGLHLIYWLRDETGGIRGAELDLARLKSDLIIALPDTPLDGPPAHARTELLDAKRSPIYAWGDYVTGKDETARATLPLSYPLGAWSLAYYGGPAFGGMAMTRGLLFNVVSGLVLLSVAVVGLAVYFYRESARDMREAAQRVSFVNQVSHELKTPLTNIRMYAEMLDGELAEGDERPRRHVDIIVSESQRLSRLIGNILTFNRQGRHALRLRPEPGEVDTVLRSVLDHYGPSLKSKEITVSFEAGAPARVLLDPDVFEQIAGNLISNVEKYAAKGGQLSIRSAQDGERVTVQVCDNGPGIPEKDRENVFKPFFRVSNRVSDGITGTGIGLTIARELARLHGGDLELEPGSTGDGARFRLTLSCPPAPDEETV